MLFVRITQLCVHRPGKYNWNSRPTDILPRPLPPPWASVRVLHYDILKFLEFSRIKERKKYLYIHNLSSLLVGYLDSIIVHNLWQYILNKTHMTWENKSNTLLAGDNPHGNDPPRATVMRRSSRLISSFSRQNWEVESMTRLGLHGCTLLAFNAHWRKVINIDISTRRHGDLLFVKTQPLLQISLCQWTVICLIMLFITSVRGGDHLDYWTSFIIWSIKIIYQNIGEKNKMLKAFKILHYFLREEQNNAKAWKWLVMLLFHNVGQSLDFYMSHLEMRTDLISQLMYLAVTNWMTNY